MILYVLSTLTHDGRTYSDFLHSKLEITICGSSVDQYYVKNHSGKMRKSFYHSST